MPYNGSGVYTLPGAQLANGEIVSATENNQMRNDVATALNVAWTRDGQAPATANIPMGSHKFTGLAAGTGNGDSVRYEQLPSATNKLDLATSATGTLPVANGGSGATTLTGIIKGNGTSAFTAASAGTDYLAPSAIGTTVQAYSAELQGATQGGINGMKNRIINGAMMIDQRNAGASGTGNSNYTVDRWLYYGSQASKGTWQQNAGSVTPPAGFTNYLGFTSSSAYSITATDQFLFTQSIEGLNVADLGWGTANAATVTISFWVRSSLTGTFGGAVQNSAQNRCYPFSFTINAANTWEQKTITIAGDTTGTWLTNNGKGIGLQISLGTGSTYSAAAGSWTGSSFISSVTGATSVVGTNGATFYITGVQLEKGSAATSFDYRPYGTELALCQRYFYDSTQAVAGPCGSVFSAAYAFPVTMRATPTLTYVSAGNITDGISNYTTTGAAIAAGYAQGGRVDITVSGLTAGRGGIAYGQRIQFSSEL